MDQCTWSNVSHESLGNNKELRSSPARNYEISDKTFLFFSVEFRTSVAAKPASSAGLNALKSGSTPPLTKSASNQQPVGTITFYLLLFAQFLVQGRNILQNFYYCFSCDFTRARHSFYRGFRAQLFDETHADAHQVHQNRKGQVSFAPLSNSD